MALDPQAEIDDVALAKGLRNLTWEAGFSNLVSSLTSGVILTAYAMQLGASNALIGVLAALTFWAQITQAPAVLLVEGLRTRKRITVWSSLVSRAALAIMAALALLPAGGLALSGLVLAQGLFCCAGAIGGCAWNSWVRDLAPEHELGKLFARRTTYATVVSLAAGLLAAMALDVAAEDPAWGGPMFAGLYALGFLAGLVSIWLLSRTPEPMMPPVESKIKILPLLRTPLRDRNFMRLIRFLASWQFAVNLATPFITVYLVRQLGFPLAFVMVLSVVSQIANLFTVRSWGVLSDRFTNKSVLTVAAPVFIACIAALVGASQITDRTWCVVYLVGLHILMGAAQAGVTLASGNIALKLSPKGSSTAYLATSALVSSMAAGAAPILGGLFADFFAARRLEIMVRWFSPGDVMIWLPLRLSNWDFYFLLAAFGGLYALHRLSLVREEGEIEPGAMVGEVIAHARRTARNLSPVAGLRLLTDIPAGLMDETRARLARRRYLRGQVIAARAGRAKPEKPRAWLRVRLAR